MKRKLLLISLSIVILLCITIYIFSQKGSTLISHRPLNLGEKQSQLTDKTLPYHVVALGDSLTKGKGDPNHKGYAGYTMTLLSNNSLFDPTSLHNYGVTGDTTDDLLKVLKKKAVLNEIKKSQVIFLTIGGNDLLNVLKKHFLNLKVSDFDHQQKHYEQNFETILNLLQNTNPRVTVYYLGLFNPFQDYFDNLDQFNRIIKQWNTASQTILNQHPHMNYVPIYDLFDGKSNTLFSQDHLHPNADGYHLMANRLYQYITQNK